MISLIISFFVLVLSVAVDAVRFVRRQNFPVATVVVDEANDVATACLQEEQHDDSPIAVIDAHPEDDDKIQLRQEKERQLYAKWLAAKKAEKDNIHSDEQVPIDVRTRAILFKLKTQDHFGLRLTRQVSTNERATVYYATGENDMKFAFKVFHSGKQPAKKAFARLIELEKNGKINSPSPVLFRGHVLVTKWMDEDDGVRHGEEVESQQPLQPAPIDPPSPTAGRPAPIRRRDLSPASKKAQKKAVKEAQAESRRNAHLKDSHQTGKSERQKISQRLYSTSSLDSLPGRDGQRLPVL